MRVAANPKSLTWQIVIATVLGILFGLGCHSFVQNTAVITDIINILGFFTALFLRAIKMLIAPLVFAALVSGIGRMDGSGAVGRIAAKAMLWFILAALLALLVGVSTAELLKPGVGLHMHATAAASGVKVPPFDLASFLQDLLPVSIVDAMARNDVLPIVVFSIFAGLALSRLGAAGAELLRLAEALTHLMLQMATMVMRFAPVAVFTAIASALVQHGAGVILTYASFVGSYYLALLILWLAMIAAGGAVLGIRVQKELLSEVRQPALIALATTSAEAAYPSLLQKLEAFGVPNRIAGFVLPLGYSFNLIGSMCYCSFAAIFISQAFDVQLSPIQIGQLLMMLFVTSKGIANMPRASIVVVAAVAPYFSLPDAGIVFVLAADHFLDMGRTATNVVANAIVAANVAKWENPQIRLKAAT